MKISDIDSSEFDTAAMRIDQRTRNLDADFTPEQAEEYRHENIVRASMANGQWNQARQQCREYGLSYEAIKLEAAQ